MQKKKRRRIICTDPTAPLAWGVAFVNRDNIVNNSVGSLSAPNSIDPAAQLFIAR
jgi:hypothetical protein